MSPEAEKNFQRAGEYFIFTLWLQGQMSDLIILAEDENIREQFLKNKEQIPSEMVGLRAGLWEKSFSRVCESFEGLFEEYFGEQDKEDINAILYLRNSIAHARVFAHKPYFLYRPSGGENKERRIASALNVPESEEAAEPVMFSLHL